MTTKLTDYLPKKYSPTGSFGVNFNEIPVNWRWPHFLAMNLPPMSTNNKYRYVEYEETAVEGLNELYHNFNFITDFLRENLNICLTSTINEKIKYNVGREPDGATCGYFAPSMAYIMNAINLNNPTVVTDRIDFYVTVANIFYSKVAYNHDKYSLHYSSFKPENDPGFKREEDTLMKITHTNYPRDDGAVCVFSLYCPIPTDFNHRLIFNTEHHFCTMNKQINTEMYVYVYDSWTSPNSSSRDMWGRIMKINDFVRMLDSFNRGNIRDIENSQDITTLNQMYDSYFAIPHSEMNQEYFLNVNNTVLKDALPKDALPKDYYPNCSTNALKIMGFCLNDDNVKEIIDICEREATVLIKPGKTMIVHEKLLKGGSTSAFNGGRKKRRNKSNRRNKTKWSHKHIRY